MTTNQTIDGVSRELLSDFLEHRDNGDWYDGVWITHRDRLRAQLDAPAQPQGEPVAFEEWFRREIGDPGEKNCKGVESRDVYVARKAWDFKQPAPVAVLAGGRRTGKAHLAALLESLAKQVYDSWQSQPGWVPWQDDMHGSKQNEARHIASRMFELALANQVGGDE